MQIKYKNSWHVCELKGIGYYLRRLQPCITDHNGNKCKNVVCYDMVYTNCINILSNNMFTFPFFILNKFITIKWHHGYLSKFVCIQYNGNQHH